MSNDTKNIAKTMNIEDYREFCLSLGADVEEKLPTSYYSYFCQRVHGITQSDANF